ncbi:MAG: zinc chelation protein SecC [Rhodopseudomonas palustris]|nr:zinc chelation protein SecC [Rhodopseudomonas palustris]
MECPCCSGKPYEQCCEPLLAGRHPAASPEALMRSRYTAFATSNFDYVWDTTDPKYRDEFSHAANCDWMSSSLFTGLQVLAASDNGKEGTVEFIARFRRGPNPEARHHERSRFRMRKGRWLFCEGDVISG